MAELSAPLHAEFVTLFWYFLPLFFIVGIAFSFFSSTPRSAAECARRALVCILLYLSFDFASDFVLSVAEYVLEKLEPFNKAREILIGAAPEDSVNYWGFDNIVFRAFLMLSYLLVSLAFYFTDTGVQFVWAVLYILSPLLILGYIHPITQGAAIGLYTSLCKLMALKVVWTHLRMYPYIA